MHTHTHPHNSPSHSHLVPPNSIILDLKNHTNTEKTKQNSKNLLVTALSTNSRVTFRTTSSHTPKIHLKSCAFVSNIYWGLFTAPQSAKASPRINSVSASKLLVMCLSSLSESAVCSDWSIHHPWQRLWVFIFAASFTVIIFHDLSSQQNMVQEKNHFYIRGYPNRWNPSANFQSLDSCLANRCFLSVLSISTPLLLNSCISG